MARRRDDPDDDDFDEELPDGVYHDDAPAMIACPYCRGPVYEEAQYCPRCENYISSEGRRDGKPLWVWVCLILALLAAVFMAFN